MARTPYLLEFAQRHGLRCITIDELACYISAQRQQQQQQQTNGSGAGAAAGVGA